MRKIFIFVLASFLIATSIKCPVWKCVSDISKQQNKDDKDHCVEFIDDNTVYLYNQKEACKTKGEHCYLYEAVSEINKRNDEKFQDSSSYCYSGLEVEKDKFIVENDNMQFRVYRKDCQKYNEAVKKCKPFDTEEWEELYDSQEFNFYEDEDQLYGWQKCSSNKDCLSSDGCSCVPNDGTFGRCSSSFLDYELIEAAFAFAACEYKDQEVFCILHQFYSDPYAPYFASYMEEDLNCLEDQTWDLQYLKGVDLERVISAFYDDYYCYDYVCWIYEFISNVFSLNL